MTESMKTVSESDLRSIILAKTKMGLDYFTSSLPHLRRESDTSMTAKHNPINSRDEEIKVQLINDQWYLVTFISGKVHRTFDIFQFCGYKKSLSPITEIVKICAIIDEELKLGIAPATEIKIKSDEFDKADEIPRILLQSDLLPVIPKTIYEKLPPFLKSLTDLFESQQDKDLLLLSTLTVFSGCFPNIYGKYARKEIHLNLYAMIVGPASAGKSVAKWARVLLVAVEEQYEMNNSMLFFPVDVSFAALIEGLARNHGRGIMFASEADSLTQNFSKEWGDTTSLLRQAYEHERYENLRKGETGKTIRHVLKVPALSILLTGTPNQVNSLIRDTEDGLFSRFCFYKIGLDPTWRSAFPEEGDAGILNLSFDELLIPYKETALTIFNAYNQCEVSRIRFKLSKVQERRLDLHFSKLSEKYKQHTNINAIATIRRQGVVTFRIAGILTAIRSYFEHNTDVLICLDDDFNTALAISDVFSRHAFSIARQLPGAWKKKLYGQKAQFYDALPNEFVRKEAVEVGETLEIKENTVEKYLSDLIPEYLDHPKHNCYRKVGNASESSDLSEISIP